MGNELSQSLHDFLSHAQMGEIVERNALETQPGICHSQNFCNANVVLHEVFLSCGMDFAVEEGKEKMGTPVKCSVELGYGQLVSCCLSHSELKMATWTGGTLLRVPAFYG